jgi:hypothetical protein
MKPDRADKVSIEGCGAGGILNRKWGHSGFRNPPQSHAVYLRYAISQMERVVIKVLTIKDLESQHSGK